MTWKKTKSFWSHLLVFWSIPCSLMAMTDVDLPKTCIGAHTSEDTGLKNLINNTGAVLANFNSHSTSILTRGFSTLSYNINNDKCYANENNFIACVEGIRAGLAVVSDPPMSLVVSQNQPISEVIKKSGAMTVIKSPVPIDNLLVFYSLPADKQLNSNEHKDDRFSLSQIFTAIKSGKNEKVDFDSLLTMIRFKPTGNQQDIIKEDLIVNVAAQAYTESYLVPEKMSFNKKDLDIELIVGMSANKYVHCGLGCWQQDPLPNKWQDSNLGVGSIGIKVGKASIEYHNFGKVNVSGTYVDDNHWDNKGAVINDATTINYTALVKQKVQGLSIMYSPKEHTFESDKFGKWAISTPAGILIYDNVATFQAFDRDTHKYLWPNLENGTIYEHTHGVAWIASIQAEKEVGAGKLGVRVTAVGGFGPNKKDAPGGGEGLLTPGLYDVGVYYKIPIK